MGLALKVVEDNNTSYFSDEFSALEEVMRRKSDPYYRDMISRVFPTGYGDYHVVSLPIDTVLDSLIDDTGVQVQDPFNFYKSQYGFNGTRWDSQDF